MADDELQLAGMQVRFELAKSTHVSYVYLTQPDGRQRMERYEGEEIPEDAVRRSSVQIQSAAVAAQHLSGRRAGDIRTLEAELREAQKATEPIEVPQERLEKHAPAAVPISSSREHERLSMTPGRSGRT